MLEAFEARKASGTPVAEIARHNVAKVDGEKQRRFMKAIGFEQGAIRGAFSITGPIGN